MVRKTRNSLVQITALKSTMCYCPFNWHLTNLKIVKLILLLRPVFQDKNLLVQISFYKDESEYQAKLKAIDSKMNDELKTEMADRVTEIKW